MGVMFRVPLALLAMTERVSPGFTVIYSGTVVETSIPAVAGASGGEPNVTRHGCELRRRTVRVVAEAVKVAAELDVKASCVAPLGRKPNVCIEGRGPFQAPTLLTKAR